MSGEGVEAGSFLTLGNPLTGWVRGTSESQRRVQPDRCSKGKTAEIHHRDHSGWHLPAKKRLTSVHSKPGLRMEAQAFGGQSSGKGPRLTAMKML